jgi:hypothetical protein
MEFKERRRASDDWLTAVPVVGAGGFVTPIVPVAMTPGEDWAKADATKARVAPAVNSMVRIVGER